MTDWLRELDERYSDGQGISGIWGNYRTDGPWWDITRNFHPLVWGVGVQVQREVGGRDWPHWLMLSITLGPVSLDIRREWPATGADR